MNGKQAQGPERFRIGRPDLIPTARYHDPAFMQLEEERFWSRVWQMACRLEEIPEPDDFVEYRILSRSVVLIRQKDGAVKAFENACRHRGLKLCEDRGTARGGISCPFHAWHYNTDGTCRAVFQPALFDPAVLRKEDIDLVPVRVETWGGCAFITFDDHAPPLRECLGPFAPMEEMRQVEDLKVALWIAIRLPANWKMAAEAFMESYHVLRSHPQLVSMFGLTIEGFNEAAARGITSSSGMRNSADYAGGGQLIEKQLTYYRNLSEGMAGMISPREIAVAERLRGEVVLPDDPAEAMTAWRLALNKAIHTDAVASGLPIFPIHEQPLPTLTPVHFAFPNFFILPPFTAASSYRIRPLGPEECLFEIWSLDRFPEGQERPRLTTPVPMAHDDPDVPPVPTQDFANLPRQQQGIHAPSLTHLRLAEKQEGLISNFERLIDGFIYGWSEAEIRDGYGKASGAIDQPIAPMGAVSEPA